MAKFRSVEELVKQLRPVDPVYCFRRDSIKSATNWFNANFSGKVLYAVKCNPNEKILKTIISCGIKNFDTASLEEIKLIKNCGHWTQSEKPDELFGFMKDWLEKRFPV